MGCIIQIKTGNDIKIFETEEQAWSYIKKTGLELSTVKDKDGNIKQVLVNVRDGKENSAIIRKGHEIAYQKVGEIQDMMSANGWSTSEFNEKSPFLSVSSLLKDVRIIKDGDERRLFPEFIQHNYLNVLTQTEIVRRALELDGIVDEDAILEERRRVFDIIPEDSKKTAEF
jgi:hypothetical protein